MSRKFLTDIDLVSTSRIVNLPVPTAGHEPATKDYVDGLVDGVVWKNSVRAASDSNVSIATPPTGFDGVTLAEGDRILLLGQTLPAENGIYLFTNTSTALTRTDDASTAEELEQALVPVQEGTNHGGRVFRQTEVNLTLNTDPIIFIGFGDAIPNATELTPGKIELATQAETNAGLDEEKAVTPKTLANFSGLNKFYTALVGDGTATTYAITHNLQTENIVVSVREAAGNKAEVNCEIRYVDTNNISLIFAVAPDIEAIKVVVIR